MKNEDVEVEDEREQEQKGTTKRGIPECIPKEQSTRHTMGNGGEISVQGVSVTSKKTIKWN